MTTDCQACKNAFQTAAGGTDINQCLSSCPGSTGDQCSMCHPQCNGCLGTTNRDCIACKGSNVTASGNIICVPQCNMGQYLNTSTYSCQSCNDQCIGCSGPANTQCQQCKGAMMSEGGVTACLVSCPTGMYQSSNGACMNCHNLCSADGCSGPTESDCNGCTGNSVTVSANVTRCVEDCPFAHDFDADRGSCALSK